MLETPEAVFEALRENNRQPYGLGRTVRAEELAEAAEQFDKPDVLVTALLELMTAYEYTGEYRKSPVVFARVLKLLDDSPEAFSEGEVRQVFWRFKWVATSLLQVPDVPLAAIQGWTDQMRDRYRAAGHGMQPVAAMRHHIAAHTGAGREHAFDLWVTRPRESLSDCEACETRHRALHHVAAGDDRRALEVWQPVLTGGQGCAEEPYVSQAHALLPLLRQGRTDEARSYHLVGYRFARGKARLAEEVGLHVEFCALSRNEGRALEILAENRPLFDGSGAPLSMLNFLTGVEVLLRRLVADGHGATSVAGPLGRSWTAESLLAHVSGEADALAAAFDARNGTSEVGDRRRARVAQAPVLDEPLPLGLRTTTAVQAAVPVAAPAVAPEIPEDFAALVVRARELAAQGHPGDDALWARVAERVAADGHVHDPELGPEARLRAELAEQRGFAAYDEERWAAGDAAMAEAAGLFGEEAGMPWHALAARARAASAAWRSVEDADGPSSGESGETDAPDWSVLDELLRDAEKLLTDGADDSEGAEKYLTVLQCRAFAARAEAVAQLPEVRPETLERFEALAGTALSEASRLGLPHQAAGVRMYIADVAARTGRPEEAVAQLQAALEAVEASGRPWRAARPQAQLGQFMLQTGRPAEAMELLREALAGASRYGDSSFPVGPTCVLLGHAATHTGDLAAAVRYLSEGAARFDRAGDANAAAETRLQLADVLAQSGQEADAVAILESLASGEGPSDIDERLLAQIRLTLARGLRDLDEHRASAEQYLSLAGTVAAWEEQYTHTLVAAEAAVALARAGRREAADEAYERAVASHGKEPRPTPVADMMREFASLTMEAEGPDGLEAALAHLAAADALRASVPEDTEDFVHWYQAGATHYRRARALAGAERFPDALAEMERAIAAYEDGGPQGETPRAEAVRVAALIEANGLRSPEAAVARLGAGAARCEAAGLEHAAAILAGLRDDIASRRPE